MNLSQFLFNKKNSKKSALYMPYLTLGDPDFNTSIDIAKTMINAGSDILELGIPFSDPTADGPIIQKAMMRSIKQKNFSIHTIFETTKEIHQYNPELPLVYLTYFNPIYKYNIHLNSFIGESFLRKCVEIGIKGLVIPDLPFDSTEFEEIHFNIKKNNLNISIIPMIAPNTSVERIKYILKNGSGFVYYITSLGVTGFREKLPDDIHHKANLIRNFTDIPIFAGFGINTPGQVQELKKIFDGVIVGSLNHKIIEECIKEKKQDQITEKIYQNTKEFIDELKMDIN